MLNDIQGALDKMSKKAGVYLTTLFTGLATCALCCNQTLPILLTKDLMGDIYKKNGLSKSHLAIDIENTVIQMCIRDSHSPYTGFLGQPVLDEFAGNKNLNDTC